MNRRKKGIQILKAQAKRANAKLASKTKPKYISKAERERLSVDAEQTTTPNTSAQ
ncbi:MAG: DUF2986 domain-containing protein [Oceanospirillaceae bacterium]|jgi:hypothetical protein|nr:DUF2986 domain-containing protein [Oceanospirillaceae bacterium]